MSRDKDGKRKFRRVPAGHAQNIARESGGGKKYFNLPRGVGLWEPEEAGTVMIDVVPYVVKTETHPDRRGDKVQPDDLWYRFPYKIHNNIGPSKEEIVCPTTFGRPCPVCEERARLAKDYEANKSAISALNAKKQACYPIKNPDGEGYAVFAYSQFKFGDKLDEELGLDERLESFYDVTDSGRTLKVRFSKESFEGRAYLKATRIDFEERGELDEDEVLTAAPCLDEILVVMEYDDLKKLFLQIPDDGDAKPATGTKTAGKAQTPAKAGKAPQKAQEPPDEPPFKDGDKVKFTADGKTLRGVVVDVDMENDVISIETPDGNDHDIPPDDVEMDDEPEDKPAKVVKGKTAAKAAPAPAAEPAKEFRVGDKVRNDNGEEGIVQKIKGDEVTMKYKTGVAVEDIDDLTFVRRELSKTPEPDAEPDQSYEAAVGDVVTFSKDGKEITGTITKIDDNDDATIKDATGKKHTGIDVDDLSPVSEDEPGEDDEPAEESEGEGLAVGDDVEWDEGSESGTVIKVHPNGEKVKVKDGDTETWVPVEQVTKKAKPAKAGKKK